MTFTPSSSERNLDEKDVRAIARLLGEVIAMRSAIDVCRQQLMNGLSELIEADHWLWFMTGFIAGHGLNHSEIRHDGIDNHNIASFFQVLGHPSFEGMNQRISLALLSDPRASFFMSDTGPLWREAGIDSLILSFRPTDSGAVSGIGIYRKTGSPEFTEREATIAQILLSEVSWLHGREFPAQKSISCFGPRQLTVFNLLCEGWDRKRIANHLNISVQTVHGYVKEVFRHFEVHSQAELIARTNKGNGGDH